MTIKVNMKLLNQKMPSLLHKLKPKHHRKLSDNEWKDMQLEREVLRD